MLEQEAKCPCWGKETWLRIMSVVEGWGKMGVGEPGALTHLLWASHTTPALLSLGSQRVGQQVTDWALASAQEYPGTSVG